jgi:pimeloyl-ACP methyl ester carboxylesterase
MGRIADAGDGAGLSEERCGYRHAVACGLSWPGGVGNFNKIAAVPVIGPLLAYTITVPLGTFLVDSGTRYVFAPQSMPDGYIEATAVRLVLRPRVFLNNAWDLTTLKAEMVKQSPRYPSIRIPVTIVTGDTDKTVSTDIHSRPFAAAVPQTRLVVLPNGGHMPQVYATDPIVAEIEAIAAKVQANHPRQRTIDRADRSSSLTFACLIQIKAFHFQSRCNEHHTAAIDR